MIQQDNKQTLQCKKRRNLTWKGVSSTIYRFFPKKRVFQQLSYFKINGKSLKICHAI